MDKLRIVKDTPFELVLEKALGANAIWRGWSKPLLYPLLFLAASFIVLFIRSDPTWLYWVIGVGVFIVEAFTLYLFLASERKITVTIDLHSKNATRVEKLVSGQEKKNEIALDQVNRILLHSEEIGHSTKLLLDSQNHPPLEIANSYDLLMLEQGKYIYHPPPADMSEIKSLDALGKRIGDFLTKPVVGKLTEQGNLISEEVIQP